MKTRPSPPGNEHYTFPLVGKARPAVIDLFIANSLLLQLVKNWEVSLPSTCSDDLAITINLVPPHLIPKPTSLV